MKVKIDNSRRIASIDYVAADMKQLITKYVKATNWYKRNRRLGEKGNQLEITQETKFWPY